MMLTYDIAFDENFDFVKGGKLPGLRGGANNGCEGGSQPNGTDCWSTRLMWRKNGAGEGTPESYMWILDVVNSVSPSPL